MSELSTNLPQRWLLEIATASLAGIAAGPSTTLGRKA
jgi:hypothetical protein